MLECCNILYRFFSNTVSRGYEILSRSHDGRIWRASSGRESIHFDNTEEDFLPLSNVFDGAFIGTSGCHADCDALKRLIRCEISTHNSWTGGGGGDYLSASNTANLLGSTLYQRRTFPFYAFCVLAGLDKETGTGTVHVYDAIGSHERVAVAAAGSGREMLQPILDRLFSTSNLREVHEHKVGNDDYQHQQRDGNAIAAADQRRGSSLVLSPPVKTHVDCDADEAVNLLVRGYRSVAERDIGVGDEIIVCIMKTDDIDGSSCGRVEVKRFPLKQH